MTVTGVDKDTGRPVKLTSVPFVGVRQLTPTTQIVVAQTADHKLVALELQ